MARFRLIPREEKFYTDFLALADQIVSAADVLNGMLATETPDWEAALKIHDIEHECDVLDVDDAIGCEARARAWECKLA